LLTDVKNGLGFSPLTGEIITIGVYDTELNKGVVYYQAPDVDIPEYTEENFTFKPQTEKEMLVNFWKGAINYKEFISFNGRSFDVPFMMLRSMVYKVKPSINLMKNRYLNKYFDNYKDNVKHIDLLDQFSFYGAVRRKGNLHLFCRSMGIKSPKSLGITGDDVGRLFKEGKYKKIAEYNSWDLIATAELYEKWSDHIKM
jgi:predicted PolB exonuclease-like 3'-5' exonuclease